MHLQQGAQQLLDVQRIVVGARVNRLGEVAADRPAGAERRVEHFLDLDELERGQVQLAREPPPGQVGGDGAEVGTACSSSLR